jgi:hypothetical protein
MHTFQKRFFSLSWVAKFDPDQVLAFGFCFSVVKDAWKTNFLDHGHWFSSRNKNLPQSPESHGTAREVPTTIVY